MIDPTQYIVLHRSLAKYAGAAAAQAAHAAAESYAAEQQAESGIPHRVVRYVPAPTKKPKAKKGTR